MGEICAHFPRKAPSTRKDGQTVTKEGTPPKCVNTPMDPGKGGEDGFEMPWVWRQGLPRVTSGTSS